MGRLSTDPDEHRPTGALGEWRRSEDEFWRRSMARRSEYRRYWVWLIVVMLLLALRMFFGRLPFQ